MHRLRDRQEWKFFGALYTASPGYTIAWWLLLIVRGSMAAVGSVALGWLVSNIRAGSGLAAPLTLAGGAFAAQLILNPIQVAVERERRGPAVRVALRPVDRSVPWACRDRSP